MRYDLTLLCHDFCCTETMSCKSVGSCGKNDICISFFQSGEVLLLSYSGVFQISLSGLFVAPTFYHNKSPSNFMNNELYTLVLVHNTYVGYPELWRD